MPNKVNRDLKEAYLIAANLAGGKEGLIALRAPIYLLSERAKFRGKGRESWLCAAGVRRLAFCARC
jgi:hypothetical protein